MKKNITFMLLLGAFAVQADIVTVTLPKEGTFLVTISRPESCTPTEFSMAATERGFYSDMTWFLNVETARINNLFGSSMECRTGVNTSTGVFVIKAKTVLNINIVSGLEESSVTVSEVLKIRTAQ